MKAPTKTTARLFSAAALCTLTTMKASGTILGVAGSITLLPGPPPDAMPGGALESNATMYAWDEKQFEPIAGPTPVNLIGKPQTIWFDPGVQGVLMPGIDVNSHIIELDPVVGAAGLSGIIRFDTPIIGVQVLRKELDMTDYLGSPGTVYPAPPLPGTVPRRGLDWDPGGPAEVVRILPSLHELRLDLFASNSIDHVRVLTSNQNPVYDLIDPLPIPGDTDGDGDVDDSDLGTAFANYTGPVGPAGGKGPWDGDVDGDGDVDDSDLGTAFSHYTGPTSPATVPEPGSMALIALGGLMVARRRRRSDKA